MRITFRIILNIIDPLLVITNFSAHMEDIKARTVFLPPTPERGVVDLRIAEAGLRPTPQRSVVYGVLLDHAKEHPTADEVFMQAKAQKPEISMATVYNCLDALVRHRLVKQVHLDRVATRYCSNMHEHAHFLCEVCGEVSDFEGDLKPLSSGFKVPKGYKVTQSEMNMRGVCPNCTEKEVSR